MKKCLFSREYKITAAFSDWKVSSTEAQHIELDNIADIEKLPMEFRNHITIYEIRKEFSDETEAKKYFDQFSKREECWQCEKIERFFDCKAKS